MCTTPSRDGIFSLNLLSFGLSGKWWCSTEGSSVKRSHTPLPHVSTAHEQLSAGSFPTQGYVCNVPACVDNHIFAASMSVRVVGAGTSGQLLCVTWELSAVRRGLVAVLGAPMVQFCLRMDIALEPSPATI